MFKGILCTQKIHIAVYFILRGMIREREVHRNMMRNKKRLINGSKKERKDGHSKRIFTLFNDSLAIPFMKEREG